MLHIIRRRSRVVRKPGFLRNQKFDSKGPRCCICAPIAGQQDGVWAPWGRGSAKTRCGAAVPVGPTGFTGETGGPVSAPHWRFGTRRGLARASSTARAPRVWEPFASVEIMHDPVFPRLFASWRGKYQAGEKK